MLTVIRDTAKHIQLACEWHLVNSTGQLDGRGEYIWIEQLETTPSTMARENVAQLIKEIATRAPWTKSVYWGRDDKGVQVQFSRRAVMNYAEKEVIA